MRYEKDTVILGDSPGLGAEIDEKFLAKCSNMRV
jgi:hypothetical protein